MTILYGTLLSNQNRAVQEYASGVRVVHLEMGWDLGEPTDGQFNKPYFDQQKAKLQKFLSTGMQVVLGVGLQYPPNWAYSLPNSRYVNQFGRTGGGLNLTFNQELRKRAERYIAEVHKVLGLNNFCAVRVGSGAEIETLYPPMWDGVQGNSYWAYDANASLTRPYPHWNPGQAIITTARVAEWLDWYMESLVDGIEWQIAYYKSLGFRELFHVLMPGLGTRPLEYLSAVDAYLDGSYDDNQVLGRGAVYDRIVDKIVDKENLVVYESGLADGSGVPVNNLPLASDVVVDINDPQRGLWSGLRLKVAIARKYGLPVAGENPGAPHGGAYGLAMMNRVGLMAQAGGLGLVMWAHEDNLYNGIGGVSLADYKKVIKRWP